MSKLVKLARILMPRICIAAAAVFAAAASCSAVRPDPWTEFRNHELARMAESGSPESFYTVYEGSFGPMEIRLLTWLAGDNLFRMDSDMGIVKVAMGYDGNKGWIQMGDSPARELSSAEEEDVFSSLYFDGFEYLNDSELQVGEPQARNWGGAKVWEISLVSPQGYKRDLFVADGSWELAGYRAYGTSTGLMKLFDSEWIEGVQVPNRVEMEVEGIPIPLNLKLVEAEVNVEIAPDLFVPPAGTASSLIALSDEKTVVLPLQREDTGMVVIDGALGYARGLFLFDTGAAHTVLDARAAASARFKEDRPFTAIGVGGTADSRIVRGGESVSVGAGGGFRMPDDSFFIVMDLGTVSKEMGVELAGIFGADLLSKAEIRLDFARGEMAVTTNEPGDSEGGKKPVNSSDESIIRLGELVLVEGEYGPDKSKITLLVDTGFRGKVGILSSGAERMGLDVSPARGRGFVSGIGGVTRLEGSVKELDVQLFGRSWKIENAPVISGPVSSLVGGSADGLIGIELLSELVLEFDYANGVIRVIESAAN
ncbi:MAG: aspartyl protease family protein [bacterium]|jgi:predicted aspartyl protease